MSAKPIVVKRADERELLASYRRMDAEGRKMIRDTARFCARTSKPSKQEPQR